MMQLLIALALAYVAVGLCLLRISWVLACEPVTPCEVAFAVILGPIALLVGLIAISETHEEERW